ncbi:MAG: ATP-dependent RecD-like DNA helicase [Lentisphaerae bacterium]|nr:ATP-dependent RecD-like DNA helicase [Lentisphaerota bacterium]
MPGPHKHTPPRRPRTEQPEQLTGAVESVVFRNEDTGYTVCSVRLAGQRDPVTVVGSTPAMWIGEIVNAAGRWVRHPQHGLQFQADLLACVPPTSARGIERYLGSGMVRGIGKVIAGRLVKRFGEDTLRIIDKESQRLEEVEGIGPLRRKRIKESWIEQRAVRDIMIFLQSHGVGTAQAARIYRAYGPSAVTRITEDPYRLCRDIWGIGFKTADRVALSLGIPGDSDLRARAGIVYVLQALTEEGHCFCPAPELILQGQALLDIPAEKLAEALEQEVRRKALIREDERVYLGALYHAETGIAARIAALRAAPAGFPPIATDKAVAWAQGRMKLAFSPAQVGALRMAFAAKASIITGGPGVGKTTIIRALVDVFLRRRLRVQLAAPTGRAAKRMEEATGHTAKTLHRMLKYLPANGRFEFNRERPVEGDIFILDEVSMIDAPLMHAFLCAVPDRACLVLVGDVDQLPSVGPGNVLRDLIGSGTLPVTVLDTIFRQQAGGSIVVNAHRVNHGEPLETSNAPDSDFYFIETDDPDRMIARMLDLVTRRIPSKFGLDPRADVQVLTPMRKNRLGADNLNDVLQEALNPSGTEIARFGRRYRTGDRVMQIRNNYDKDVYNGDIGHIRAVDEMEQSLAVDFDGRRVDYAFAELDELAHAYACSIHKSQGSEYPAAVVLLATQHFKLLQRNLLYTAITRGKRLVCLVGSRKAVWIAIRNDHILQRRTGLRERLAAATRGAAPDGRSAPAPAP